MCFLGPLCELPAWFEAAKGWLYIAGLVVGGLLLLWALAKLKEIGGWPAVAAALAGLGYVFGFSRGRKGQDFNPLESDDPKDSEPPKRVSRGIKPGNGNRPGTWNNKENRWN